MRVDSHYAEYFLLHKNAKYNFHISKHKYIKSIYKEYMLMLYELISKILKFYFIRIV